MSPTTVRVPATSANLGPAFDSAAAALNLHLTLAVEAAEEFSLTANIDVPTDRSNLLVQAFERVLPADGYAFNVDSRIPMCGGLGSSACASLAGVLAAKALGGAVSDPLALAIEVDGVADNATASYFGGVAVHVGGQVVRLDPPPGIGLLLVKPERYVNTSDAREALPSEVPMTDAVANAGYATLLGAGLASGDPDLLARGLHDNLHQQRRSELYPESWDLLGRASSLGALGATISGAGSAVLVWVEASHREDVKGRLVKAVESWAEVLPVSFEPNGATVNGEPVAL